MAKEFAVDDKGKVRPKASQKEEKAKEPAEPRTAAAMDGKIDAAALTQMQQTVGNSAVQRYLLQRSGSGPTEVDEATASSINQNRGSGQAIEPEIAAKAGNTMGQDFSDVRVHTGGESDDLNKSLGAKAFTTGNDIFFRDGAYSPGSSDGQRLIAHELTHVVQQGQGVPSVQGKMTVNDPSDKFEAQADSVADQVMKSEEPAVVQRADMEEEEPLQAMPEVQRADVEEEEALQAMPEVQRADVEEEEALQAMPEVQRADVEEEEALQAMPNVQRQELEEETP